MEMNLFKHIRIMQHDLHGDNIRIGASFPIADNTQACIDEAEQKTIEGYEKNCAWNGGFEKSCPEFYKRVAIVDADTLEVLRLIYPKNEND